MIFRSPTVVPDVENRLSKRVIPREFYVYTVPPARKEFGVSYVRDGEGIM